MNKSLFNADYGNDSFRWFKKLEERNITKKSEIDKLHILQDEIIENKDAALAYFFAVEFDYKTYRMQKVILDNQDARYALLFAKDIVNCDIKALQNVVIASKKMKYICDFACFVNKADLDILKPIILKSKNAKYASMWLKLVSDHDVRFKHIIFNSKNPKYLFELAKNSLSKTEIKKIEDLLIDTKSLMYIRLFASRIKHANVDRLEQIILSSNNIHEIKKFAKQIKNSKMRKFLAVL